MELIIKGLLENMQFKKFSTLIKDNKYDLLSIIFIVLTLIANVSLFFCTSYEMSIGTYISLAALVLFIILSEIFISLGGKYYSTSKYAKDEKLESLKNIVNHLQTNGIVNINKKEDVLIFTEFTQKYYNEKFSTVNSLQKTVTQISKFVLLPIVLAVANKILDTQNDIVSFENKLFYIFIFLVAVMFITISVIIVFDFCKSIIKLKNIKLAVLLSDLELLSKFNIIENN